MKIMSEILNGIKVRSGVETTPAALAPLFLVHCTWRQHTCITLQHQHYSLAWGLCVWGSQASVSAVPLASSPFERLAGKELWIPGPRLGSQERVFWGFPGWLWW